MNLRENVEYDFSLFEPKESKSEKKPERPKVVKRAAPRASVKPATIIKYTAACLIAMLTLSAIMLSNLQLTSLSDQVTAAQKKLDTAKSEEIRLNIQLANRTSLDNLENYAVNQLGLEKASPYQVEYVSVNSKDKVEVEKQNPNIFKRLFDCIVEYL